MLLPLNRAEALSNPLSFSQEESFFQEKVDGVNVPLDAKAPPAESKNQKVLLPSEEIDQREAAKEPIDMEDLFGSEQVFPFEPGFS